MTDIANATTTIEEPAPTHWPLQLSSSVDPLGAHTVALAQRLRRVFAQSNVSDEAIGANVATARQWIGGHTANGEEALEIVTQSVLGGFQSRHSDIRPSAEHSPGSREFHSLRKVFGYMGLAQAVFDLSFVQGLSIEDVGAQLSLQPAAVEAVLHEIRDFLISQRPYRVLGGDCSGEAPELASNPSAEPPQEPQDEEAAPPAQAVAPTSVAVESADLKPVSDSRALANAVVSLRHISAAIGFGQAVVQLFDELLVEWARMNSAKKEWDRWSERALEIAVKEADQYPDLLDGSEKEKRLAEILAGVSSESEFAAALLTLRSTDRDGSSFLGFEERMVEGITGLIANLDRVSALLGAPFDRDSAGSDLVVQFERFCHNADSCRAYLAREAVRLEEKLRRDSTRVKAALDRAGLYLRHKQALLASSEKVGDVAEPPQMGAQDAIAEIKRANSGWVALTLKVGIRANERNIPPGQPLLGQITFLRSTNEMRLHLRDEEKGRFVDLRVDDIAHVAATFPDEMALALNELLDIQWVEACFHVPMPTGTNGSQVRRMEGFLLARANQTGARILNPVLELSIDFSLHHLQSIVRAKDPFGDDYPLEDVEPEPNTAVVR